MKYNSGTFGAFCSKGLTLTNGLVRKKHLETSLPCLRGCGEALVSVSPGDTLARGVKAETPGRAALDNNSDE